MDRDTQTSFIPKTLLTKSGSVTPRAISLPTVIAVLVFLLSLALWGGAYGYEQYLDNQINASCTNTITGGANEQRCGLKESINRARQDLDQATTLSLRRLNDKLLIGNELVGAHQTALPVLRLLEELTLPTVYYTRLGYSAGALTIEGRASSYEDIAVQTQVFIRDQGRIKSFLFSDLDLDNLGNVIFKLVLNLEPEVLLYLRTLTAGSPTTP